MYQGLLEKIRKAGTNGRGMKIVDNSKGITSQKR